MKNDYSPLSNQEQTAGAGVTRVTYQRVGTWQARVTSETDPYAIGINAPHAHRVNIETGEIFVLQQLQPVSRPLMAGANAPGSSLVNPLGGIL